MDRLAVRWPWVSIAGLLVLLLPLRTIATLNVDRTSFWVDQAIPDAVFDTVAELEARSERPLLIGGHYYLSEAWNYGREQRGERAAPLDFEVFPQPVCDVLILDTAKHIAPAGFHTVYTAPTGRLVLKFRDRPLVGIVVFDTSFTFLSGTNEFIELWKPADPSSHLGKGGLAWIQVSPMDEPAYQAALITELRTSDGQHAYYDKVFLGSMRRTWGPDAFDLVRRIPIVGPEISSIDAYIYNPGHEHFGHSRIRVRAIELVE